MPEFRRHIFNAPLWSSVQVTKLPTFFIFLRVPLTHLDRWLAFFTKFPMGLQMLPDYVVRASLQMWLLSCNNGV